MGCKVIKSGEFSAIMCGGKVDHECDGDGPELVFNQERYFLKSACPSWEDDPEKAQEWMIENKICGGCVSCSICGSPFTPPLY